DALDGEPVERERPRARNGRLLDRVRHPSPPSPMLSLDSGDEAAWVQHVLRVELGLDPLHDPARRARVVPDRDLRLHGERRPLERREASARTRDLAPLGEHRRDRRRLRRLVAGGERRAHHPDPGVGRPPRPAAGARARTGPCASPPAAARSSVAGPPPARPIPRPSAGPAAIGAGSDGSWPAESAALTPPTPAWAAHAGVGVVSARLKRPAPSA